MRCCDGGKRWTRVQRVLAPPSASAFGKASSGRWSNQWEFTAGRYVGRGNCGESARRRPEQEGNRWPAETACSKHEASTNALPDKSVARVRVVRAASQIESKGAFSRTVRLGSASRRLMTKRGRLFSSNLENHARFF